MAYDDTLVVERPQKRKTEARRHDRFYILDEDSWALTVNDQAFPISAIQDLNSVGMQLMVRSSETLSPGETFSIHLALFDFALIQCEAVVRWVAPSDEEPGIHILGLQFQDPNSRIPVLWHEREVKLHVSRQRLDDMPELELVKPTVVHSDNRHLDRRREVRFTPDRRSSFQPQTSGLGGLLKRLGLS